MRLSKDEITGILRGLSEVAELKAPYDLFLFGSRANDEKLGGDIDLLIVVAPAVPEQLQPHKHLLLAKAKKYIADQRLDITLKSSEKLDGDPFYQSIKSELIRLA